MKKELVTASSLLRYTLVLTFIYSFYSSSSFSEATKTETDGKGPKKKGKKIAIVGGSIAGTFTAKYLSDYDKECSLDSITIYEPYSIPSKYPKGTSNDGDVDNVIPYPVDAPSNLKEEQQQEQQGPRVSSIQLLDAKSEIETIVELGASIIFSGNKLAVEMLENDDALNKVKPLSSQSDKIKQNELHSGMGIYNGIMNNGDNGNNDDNSNNSHITWPLLTSNMTKAETKKKLIWRYNLDLYKIDKITEDALTSFDMIYGILKSNQKSSFDYASPNDLWKQVGLNYAASVSLDQLLDHIGVSKYLSWWRKWLLSDQGLVRDEIFAPMNICNNNKNNAQMTGLAGLVNFVASKGDLFAVKGGNHKLIESAFDQAKSNYAYTCNGNSDDKVIHVPKRIKTVVSDFETNGMQLFDSDGKRLGEYDVVIIATPLQFSDISFMTRGSMFDTNVLHPMTLNGMVDSNDEDSNANEHEHRAAFPGGNLPDSAIRPYTQVVTTVVSNAKLNKSYFTLDDDLAVPKSILFTVKGREESGISSIGQITAGVFKVFSTEELTNDKISSIFGNDVKVEHVKVWGGYGNSKNGGATPDFNGGGDSSFSTQFLLYDGGHGVGGFDEDGSALYYVNSMESAVSAIEISAIGALAVSKLVAQRLMLLQPIDDDINGEEL